MRSNMFLLASVAMVAMASPAFATDDPACPTGTTSCTVSNQHMGDTSTQSTATNTHTNSSQAGVSSASNQSGNGINTNVNPDIQTTQNATTTTGAIGAYGGASSSTGNFSDNDNKSSASNGNMTATTGSSSSGGNQMNGLGGSVAGSGNSSSTAAGGAGGSSDFSGTVTGGAGGAGGAGLGLNTGDVTGGAGGAVKDSGNATIGNVGTNAGQYAGAGAGALAGAGAGANSGNISGDIGNGNGNGNGSGNDFNNDSKSTSNSNSGGNTLGNAQGQMQNASANGNGSGNSVTGGDVKLGVESNLIGGDTTVTGGDQKVNADQRNNVDASSANSNKQNTAVNTGATTQTNAGNNSKSTQTNAGNNSSNAAQGNTTSVDASDRSVTNYSSKTLFIPPVVPATPPSQVAIGNIIKETLACGPLQTVVKTPIVGTRSGLIGKSKVDQGFTYDLAPYTDKDGNIVDYRQVALPDGSGYRLFGSQVVMFSTVIGISGGGNLAIGGGGGNQSWGQGGFGTSSSNTRLVTNIQVAQCEVGTVKYVPVEREVPVKPKGQ